VIDDAATTIKAADDSANDFVFVFCNEEKIGIARKLFLDFFTRVGAAHTHTNFHRFPNS